MMFSCEQPNAAMTTFMIKASLDCRPGCNASTMPLYTMQFGNGIQCGSGVLLQILEKHFIITAAHTFDKLKAAGNLPLFIISGIVGDNLIPLNGITLRSSKTSDPISRHDDPFDICVCELPSEIAIRVKKGKRFLHLNEVDPFDRLEPRSWYMVFGCPTVWNPSDDGGRRVFSTACSLNTFVYCGERGKLPNVETDVEILMDFNQETCVPDNEGDPGLPDPNGMSGCGIWRLVEAATETTRWKPDDIRLVGIEHTWNKEFHVLRGTRIRFALQLIRLNHTDLWSAFELHYQDRARLL
jgi:hypothetical protein